MRKAPPNQLERHAFAAAGCSVNQFADHFQVGYSTARDWMRSHNYDSIKEREDNDVSPRSIEGAYYALAASILLDWTSKQSLREIAQ